ncbi:MAG: universal stress protein [Desulfomonilaceae bacterium]
MFKSVISAVDGSVSSLNALRQAIALAKSEKGVTKVLSVAPPYTGDLGLVGVHQHVDDVIKEPYRKALEQAKIVADQSSVVVKTILEVGEPAEKIVEIAEDLNCDLIVVGTQGGNPAKTALVGSTASTVIGLSHINVLAVPATSFVNLDRILLAVDGSDCSNAAALAAFEIQKSYGSKIVALAVADIPSHLYGLDANAANRMLKEAVEALDNIRLKSDEIGAQIEPIVREGSPTRIINETASEKRIGLIVMGSHGRTGLKRLLMGSVAAGVIGRAPCPVLIAKHPA